MTKRALRRRQRAGPSLPRRRPPPWWRPLPWPRTATPARQPSVPAPLTCPGGTDGTGISEEMGDVGMAMQRAEDKTQQLQARASALDELIDSGGLEDATLPAGRDDIRAQLDAATEGHGIEAELARMRAQLKTSASPPSLEAGEKPAASAAGPSQEPPEAESTSR
ncbi:PspA/IM30 family protein [Streptantibioticus rubrisoli]|uniref:Uncharacterized protein n=1 Tax=Streptantibioticus rubrisoli TaxID=1387313 RepID=A0ABT1PBH2_9ACTN|nr:hypothetical protein [Streptantibioticus rubrisoli]MCQ4042725.1 hypothetical protein [Streptantibioticus rubrisoli]